ncbi:Putative lysosomal cobalamin transporterlike, partial [Caligus rogercresseyi]
QRARSFVNRLLYCIRPFEMIFGITFSVCSFFILWILPRQLHTPKPHRRSTPIHRESLSPGFYHIYQHHTSIIFGSASGLRTVGIGCFCIPAYEVRSGSTEVRGLIWVCAILIYIIIALNAFMFSLVPNYTTFGDQVFIMNNSATGASYGNASDIFPCNSRALGYKEHCYKTQISYLLTAYHDTVWIFDAMYYWLHWVFVVVVLIGACFSVHLRRHSFYRSQPLDNEEGDQEGLVEEEDP